MAVNFPEPKFAETNGIRIAYYEMGEGVPVLLCHGFPELAFSWHRVMPRLAEAGFRAIAADQRGYGRSDCPPRTEDYAVSELAADMAGLLDALGLNKAVYVGHDWGGPVVWSSALLQRDHVAGVVGVNTPYRPAPLIPRDPLVALREEWGDDQYVVNFHNKGPDKPDSSDAKFNAHLDKLFTGLYRKALFRMSDFQALPKEKRILTMENLVFAEKPRGEFVLTQDELDYFLAAFRRTGITPGLNWYRNISANWRAVKDLDPNIHVPCMMIEATDDPSGPPGCSEPMKPYVADLEVAVLEDCGHWTGHERPDELCDIMIPWLKRKFG